MGNSPFNKLQPYKRFLSEQEIEHILSSPDGLRVVAEYHDLQMTMGQPMGFSCSDHQARYDELITEAKRLEWEESHDR